MSIKFLTQLSHFITMMFGIALGMTLCLLYQYLFKIFIFDLAPFIIFIVICSAFLRIFTIYIWKKNNFNFDMFNEVVVKS